MSHRDAQQLLKENSIIHHCVAQILCIGFTSRAPVRDITCGAVMLHHTPVLYGKVRRILFELLAYRVAASPHDLIDQLVRLADRFLGLVDKA